MLVRFVSNIPDRRNSSLPAGLFLAARRVRDRELAPAPELERLQELRDWFNDNLARPRRFNRSTRNNRREKALSWFKDCAIEHIRRAREMAKIVTASGYEIREIHTERPGYVVYEDEHQVVAEPFADTVR